MRYSEIVEHAHRLIMEDNGLNKCVDYLEQYVLRGTAAHSELLSLRTSIRENNRLHNKGLSTDEEFRVQQNKYTNHVLTLLSEEGDIQRDFSDEIFGLITWEKIANSYREYFLDFEGYDYTLEVPVYISPPYSIAWNTLAIPLKNRHESLRRSGDFFSSAELTEVTLDGHLFNLFGNVTYRHGNDIQYASQKLIVVTGKPGSGKTTLCQHLVKHYYFSNELEKEEENLILYLKLRDLPAKLDFKEDFLTIVCHQLSNLLRSDISFYSDNQNTVFVLDGLDEIMIREGLSQQDAKDILKKITEELERSQNTYVVISCRTEFLDLSYGIVPNKLFAIRLDPFSTKEQDLWFEKYAKVSSGESWSVKDFQEIRMHAPSTVQELFDQPLLLSIIAKKPQVIVGNTLNQSGVFRKIIEQVIDREGQERGAFSKKHDQDAILRALEEIAFRMSCNTRGHVLSKSETLELWERYFPTVETADDNTEKDLLHILVGNFYLRRIAKHRESQEDQVEFIHNSFREYLTAQYILKQARAEFRGDSIERDHLSWLAKNIGEVGPTPALVDFLIELIDYEDEATLQSLSNNMERTLNQLLLQDFVDGAKFAGPNPPIRRAMQAFYYFWLIYGHSKKNDLVAGTDEQANKRFKELIKYVVKVSSYRLSFRGAKLIGLDLSGCDLNNVDFENAVLLKSRFNGCLIEDSIFSGADIRGCVMNGSTLIDTSFQNGIVEFEDTYNNEIKEEEIPTNLEDGSFRYTEFRRVDFTGADLTNCDFYFADMRGIRLSQVQIEGALLSGAKVDSPNWVYSQLRHDDEEQESDYPLGVKVSELPMLDQNREEYYLLIREGDEFVDDF